MKAGAERRAVAPHPGPLLKREYVETLGHDVTSFAAELGMSADVHGAMLDGRASIDVGTAVRIARALQLPAERIMQMQIRYDFSAVRDVAEIEGVPLLRPPLGDTFPSEYLRGQLGRSSDVTGDGTLFFREHIEQRMAGDHYAGLHALWRGDRMRVYGPAAGVLWTGPILHDFDGRMFLPYVRATAWHPWFAEGYRADLALGAAHAASLGV